MDMSGIFPLAAVTVLLVAFRVLGHPVRRARRQEPQAVTVKRPRRRINFSPTLAALWTLFLVCNAILWTQDPAYALALLITAASSCKLRRVWHTRYGRVSAEA
jgi:hypothetical protein